MKNIYHITLFLTIVGWLAMGCIQSSKANAAKEVNKPDSTAYQWTKLMDSAQWKKTYNYQMMAMGDTLWLLHPDGFWFSMDGKEWQRSVMDDKVGNQAFLDYVEFKGTVYGLGTFEGNIEKNTFTTAVHKTTDFRKWEKVADKSELPHRFFYHPFAFQDKIWIIGGEDSKGQYDDLWSSSDAIHWQKEADHLPFGKRSGSQVLTFHGKLFLLDNDVWVSDDASHWQQLTPEIFQGQQLFGYKALVFDDKIWLMGCNRNGLFSNQVLYSEDGKKWQTHDAPWLPRGGVAAAVFKDKVYLTGGKYGGTPEHTEFRYDNDLWVMKKR